MEEFTKELLANIDVTQIATNALAGITPIIAFFLATNKELMFKKRDANQKKLEMLYVPFYKKCIMFEVHNVIPFSKQRIEIIKELSLLLSTNLEYMETRTQKLFPEFYATSIDLINYRNDDSHIVGPEILNKADKVFTEFASSMLKDYKAIAKYLKLPEPLMLFGE